MCRIIAQEWSEVEPLGQVAEDSIALGSTVQPERHGNQPNETGRRIRLAGLRE